ncbi:GH92 family glycosyl hydrolase [Aestuariimicrobium ganziense]|uniref:GH92 family glycosyl hydrolase n=1 Tax=Aestuariimicrobium ganziense TaxID=2773677 RepID=UPI0019416410|nr:GH92 family glycosyl hydrolase [Aestuariimicrobium ganziense]
MDLPSGLTLTPSSGPDDPSSSTANVGLVPGQVWHYAMDGAGSAPLDVPAGTSGELLLAVFPALTFSGEVANHSSLLVGLDVIAADGTRRTLTDQHGGPFSADTMGAWVTDQWNLVRLDLSEVDEDATFELVSGAASRGYGWVQVVEPSMLEGVSTRSLGVSTRSIVPRELLDQPLDWVRTTRGSHNHSGTSISRGNTFPHVNLPHGFNFLTPVTDARSSRWLYSWHGDARDPDPRPCLQAFAFCHQPSPWIADRFGFQLMPWARKADADVFGRQLRFSHANELDRPHHYAVTFGNGLQAEMTPTSRAGVFRFVAPGMGGPDTSLVPRDHSTDQEGARSSTNQPFGVILDQAFSGSLSVTELPDGRASFTATIDPGFERNRGPYPALQGYVYGETRQPVTARRTWTREGIPELPGNVGRWITRHWPRWARLPVRRQQTVVLTATDPTQPLEVAVAMSFISTAQARRTLELEVGDAGFDEVRSRAETAWHDVLDRLEIEGATPDQLTTAYSNLARLYSWPNEHHENLATGPDAATNPTWGYASPWRDLRHNHGRHHSGAHVVRGQLHVNNGYWDTYRTCWPAYHLFTPRLARTLLDGQVQAYRDGGWTGRWVAPGPLDCMVGTSSDQVFADAASHGIRFDEVSAYDSALRNATTPAPNDVVGRKGIRKGRFVGWIDTDTDEGFSWSMENATCDATLARWSSDLAERADELGVPQRRAEFCANALMFRNRGLSWSALFDDRTGFLQGRGTDGSFRVEPGDFDPRVWGTDYTETNAWGMAFHAPQDGAGLADRLGGEHALADKLELALASPEDAAASTSGHYAAGMHERLEARSLRLGQIGISNQPAHHTPYMFAFTGEHHRTQWLTREILHRLFVGSDIGQGYPGDEDNGEMSAWWLFSAMGLYPLHLASGEYVITAPLFERFSFRRDNDRTIEVRASVPEGMGVRECRYIQSVALNGEVWDDVTVPISVFEDDVLLEVGLGPEPSDWAKESRPKSLSTWRGSPGPLWRTWQSDLTLRAQVERHDASGARLSTGLVDDQGEAEDWGRGDRLLLGWEEPVACSLLTLTTDDRDAPPLRIDVRLEGSEEWQPLHVGWRSALWADQTQAYLVEPEGPVRALRLTADGPARLRQLELY